MNIPNCITVFRMLLIGVYAYFFQTHHYVLALITYIVAALSDLLDGYLARKWNQITAFGKLMDPLADKLLLLVALFCFSIQGFLPWFIFGFVLAKESIMILAGILLYKHNTVVYAMKMGKLATLAFNIAVIASFALPFFQSNLVVYPTLHTVVVVLYSIGIVLGVLAAMQYMVRFLKKEDTSEN